VCHRCRRRDGAYNTSYYYQLADPQPQRHLAENNAVGGFVFLLLGSRHRDGETTETEGGVESCYVSGCVGLGHAEVRKLPLCWRWPGWALCAINVSSKAVKTNSRGRRP